MREHVQGTVYLLHFLQPIGNPANPRAMAQHYLGTPVSSGLLTARWPRTRGSSSPRHGLRAAVAPNKLTIRWQPATTNGDQHERSQPGLRRHSGANATVTSTSAGGADRFTNRTTHGPGSSASSAPNRT
jgi:hypothetical protein